MRKKIVVESPLKGKTPEEQRRNFRYALWCCRWVRLQGHTVYASHIGAPLFLDDSVKDERYSGIRLTYELTDDSWHHWFFTDLGDLIATSRGAAAAFDEFVVARKREYKFIHLQLEDPEMWAAFERGEWPPHTAGLIMLS